MSVYQIQKTGVGGVAFYSVNTFLFVIQNNEFLDDEKCSSSFVFFGTNLRVQSLRVYNHIEVDVWMADWVCFKFIMSLS